MEVSRNGVLRTPLHTAGGWGLRVLGGGRGTIRLLGSADRAGFGRRHWRSGTTHRWARRRLHRAAGWTGVPRGSEAPAERPVLQVLSRAV